MADETEDTGATSTSRALNKLKQVQKALASNPEASRATGEVIAIINKLNKADAAAFEAALARRRSNVFVVGGAVTVKAEFSKVYTPKGPHTITHVETMGGDDNGRGGRTFLKVKATNGNVIAAPASCFDPA